MCGLKVTVLEHVMVSIIAGKFTDASWGILNSTIPNLDDVGYDKRMSWLEKSSNT